MYTGEDVIDFQELPENATDVRPKKGLYLPKYAADKREWFESASEEYIESIQKQNHPKQQLPSMLKSHMVCHQVF